MLGRDAIVGWSEPEKLMESNRTLAPDCFFGNENYIEKVNEVASDYALRNPIVNSDGQHLIVTDDLDCKLFVYKDIPTDSGAKADYIYDLEISPNDACIYTDESGKTNVYIYRGIPNINDNYIAKVAVDAASTFGCVKSNGEYFSISDNSLADGSNGALVF